MKVTARQIAEKIGVSAAAVSMALNNKPGVSLKMRHKIIDAAVEMGYDFTRINNKRTSSNTIAFILFHKNMFFDTPFFSDLTLSVEATIRETGYQLFVHHIHDYDNLEEQLHTIRSYHFEGIILLGTTMSRNEVLPFEQLGIPVVLLDAFFPNLNMDCVTISNVVSAETITDYLIKKRQQQPGYLHSSFDIVNFGERSLGFFNAVRKNAMSSSQSIVHRLAPSADGAYADMMEVLKHEEPLAGCYFADNDEIAIGAIRAFKETGFRIPEDIAVAGFDNIPYSTFIEPPLTTIDVPKTYMGSMAVKQLLTAIRDKSPFHIKIEINTSLVIRGSI